MAVENIYEYMADLSAMKSLSHTMVGFAEKDSSQYKCQSYRTPTQHSCADFDEFGQQKLRVYDRLRDVFGTDPQIQLPEEILLHNDHWFVFTKWNDDCVLPENRPTLIAAMSTAERIALIDKTAKTLTHLHRHNIVHGNLTASSIMPYCRPDDLPDAQLTGLEDAFFEDAVPEYWSKESAPYASPELAFAHVGRPLSSDRKSVTVKADIFSLGLILHEYLAGSAPIPESLPAELQLQLDSGHMVSPWQILTTPLPDGSLPRLIVSPQIKEPYLVALISDMLHLEPDRRPSAEQISRRLKRKDLPIESQTWPGDGITINPDVAHQRVIGLRKYAGAPKGTIELYEIILTDGRRSCLTSRQLIREGIASVVEIVDPPWPGDHFCWDEPKLKTMFVCARRGARSGVYQMIDAAGNSRLCTAAQLKMLRFAIPTRGVRDSELDCTVRPIKGITPNGLWAEDHQLRLRVNPAAAASLGLMFDGAAEFCSIRGYAFLDQAGNTRFITRSGCHLLNILSPCEDGSASHP